jgi:hypothetical protein
LLDWIGGQHELALEPSDHIDVPGRAVVEQDGCR